MSELSTPEADMTSESNALARQREEIASVLRDCAMQVVTQGVLITDPNLPDNPIIYASPGFLRLTGYELQDVLGRNCRFLSGPDTDPQVRAQIRDAIRDGRPLTVVLCNYRKDGTKFWNELSLTPVIGADGGVAQFVGLQNDVSERRHSDEQHEHSRRMETIGHLAGSIAHDCNNLLTVIVAYSDLLKQSAGFDATALASLMAISDAGVRAAELTKRLLVASRDEAAVPEPNTLNTILRDMEPFLRRVIADNIEISIVLQSDLDSVAADPGLLAQLVLALAICARYSLGQGGTMLLETQNVVVTDEYAVSHTSVKRGPYVQLSVKNTCSGTAAYTMHQQSGCDITTNKQKSTDDWNLSVVQSLVAHFGGHFEIEGQLASGDTFRVLLPRSDLGAT